MDMRKRAHYFVLIMVVIILFLPGLGYPADFHSERMTQELPDVTITNLTFSKSEPKEGENITISVTVRNNESFTIPDEDFRIKNLTITLMRFEENITEKEISIEGETNATFNFTWKAVGGRQNITAFLSGERPDSNERIPLDDMSREIWIEPEPIGDVYYPILALALIFVVIFGSVVIPSLVASLTDKSSTRKSK
ncbi:MAG: hypothetical protein ACOCTN_06595 [Candidatus Natronoplasma sp.]